MAVKTSEPIEITLPSGVFAFIRPISFLDGMRADFNARAAELAYAAGRDEDHKGLPMYIPALISRCVLFDGAKVSIEDVLAMDSRDTGAIITALMPYIKGPIT